MNVFDVLRAAEQFKSNPFAALSARYNLPSNMSNPQEIVQHLLNSGQVTQAQVNQAMRMKNDPSLRNIFR